MNRVSIVSACRNREENLLNVIETWLALDCHEIVLVDWSCDIPLFESLKQAGVHDKRIRMLRVEGEGSWILTHAYNVGLKRISGNTILKLDNDHRVKNTFLSVNDLSDHMDARIGSWRLVSDTSQSYINGAFMAREPVLRRIGYFNEMITTYGWDDSYLYDSLFSSGAAIGYLHSNSIQHIEQNERSRTSQQSITLEEELAVSLGKRVTEFMNRRNMYLTSLMPRQTADVEQSQYQSQKTCSECGFKVTFLKRLSNPSRQIDRTYIGLANLLAYRDFYAWENGLKPPTLPLGEIHKLHHALEPIRNIEDATILPLQQKSMKHSENPSIGKHIQEKLWQLLPTAAYYYGHTTNELRYCINLHGFGLDDNDLNCLNSYLPEWAGNKVNFSINLDEGPDDFKIVKPMVSSEKIVEATLFNPKTNQYFLAFMNAVKPVLKRSLYDLIEKGGKPIDIILSRTVSSFTAGLIDESEVRRRLSGFDLIYPSTSSEKYAEWVDRQFKEIRSYAGSELAAIIQNTLMQLPRVGKQSLTLTTALYQGSKHIIRYVLNMRRMHLFSRTNLVISIAPSEEMESQAQYLLAHFSDCSNVSIVKTDVDPGLYECWNDTIRNAATPYVGNANIDDRRGRYHSDYLIYLMEYLGFDGASSALVADRDDTHSTYSHSQDLWFLGMGREVKANDLLIEDEGSVTSQNLMHCMPIWRRDIHTTVGYFHEDEFGTSADWEFWLRASRAGKRLLITDLPLGFYLLDSKSHNRRDLVARRTFEERILQTHFPEIGSTKEIRFT